MEHALHLHRDGLLPLSLRNMGKEVMAQRHTQVPVRNHGPLGTQERPQPSPEMVVTNQELTPLFI